MRRIWETPGGIHPEQNKAQSTREKIGTLDLPPEIILPLGQHIGMPATPIVTVGETVLKGQLVAEAEGLFSAGVHASTSGIVSAIEERVITHPSGMSALCIVITPDGEDTWTALSPCENYQNYDRHELLEHIRNAGIVGMGGAGFPTAIKVNPKSNRHVKTLILNGTECEPYITADDMLMRERAEDILKGAQLLAYLLGEVDEVLVGIEDNKPEAIAAMNVAAEQLKDEKITVVTFPTKYPSGGEKQLIQILTGKEVPAGGLPAQLGIVVQNVGTALCAYRAVKFGEPLISRVTTVVGRSLTRQRNIDVLIGTPISFVLEQHGFVADGYQRLIIGGPMMGFAAENQSVPVVKTTNCILAPTAEEMPEPAAPQACIRCGMCAQACPASLLPQQLYWYSRSEDFDKLEDHNLFDCIECGACSYVCPSNIPLVQYYRASKGAIKHHREEKEKSDRSRERFEKRQERIAKEDAAKEAKRLARKLAAEQAKKIIAEKKLDEANTALTDMNAQKLSHAPTDPKVQKAKFERSLSSAESRLKRAKEQLQKNIEEDQGSRKDSLAAKVKQAELKVQDALKKLNSLDDDITTAPKLENVGLVDNPAVDKQNTSPAHKLTGNIASIEKKLSIAKQKLLEAQAKDHASANALSLGVEKLEKKLSQAIDEQSNLPADNPTIIVTGDKSKPDPALNAIQKAKAKAQAQTNLSEDEKKQQQIKSLSSRLQKAKERWEKAVLEKDDNADAFAGAYKKLEAKLDKLTNH